MLERERLQALLNDVIVNESETLPDPAIFMLETIAKGMEIQEIDSVQSIQTPGKDTH